MMMKMISETENITQQHGPDKQQGYTVQHREIQLYSVVTLN